MADVCDCGWLLPKVAHAIRLARVDAERQRLALKGAAAILIVRCPECGMFWDSEINDVSDGIFIPHSTRDEVAFLHALLSTPSKSSS